MPNYPVAKLVVPAELQHVANGKLKQSQLKPLKCGGFMWHGAADAFNRMYVAAKKDGFTLRNIGDYRSYPRQEALFLQRYADKPTGRNPKVTRTWQGKTWYLKKGMSPCGVPGTSNHGLGLAIDLDVTNPKLYAWLDKHGPDFGFYLQGKPTTPDGKKNPEFEAWHWQYCPGR